MEQNICPRLYVKNQHSAGWSLNAIPVQPILIPDNNGNMRQYYQMYFPRPWLIVGLVNTLGPASTSPLYLNSELNPLAPGDQQTYKDMLQSIFLDCAFATMHEYSPGFAVNYVEPGIQARDYRGYFTKYLSNDALNTRQQKYWSMCAPLAIIKNFINDNAALAAGEWGTKHREMMNFLKTGIDQNLMGAPGVYRIGETGGTNPVWASYVEHETFVEE